MPKIITILLLFTILIFSTSVFPQIGNEPNNSSTQTDDLVEVVIEETKNGFEHLLATSQIVYQLRKNYGVKGSVLLSQSLWQILNSYSNQQQAINTWQTSINDVSNLDAKKFEFMLNPHYDFGQIISKYSNGLEARKWNKERSTIKLNKSNLTDFFASNDDLTIYFNLSSVWELMLVDIAKQEDIQWQEVFLNSLDLFSQEPSESDETSEAQITKQESQKNREKYIIEKTKGDEEKQGKEQENQQEVSVFNEISHWQARTDKNFALADLMQFIEALDQPQDQMYHQSLLRFVIQRPEHNYLATAMSWFALAQQLYIKQAMFSPEELVLVQSFIESNDAWFLSKEQPLLTINEALPKHIETSFHHLKIFYQNPSMDAPLDDYFISIYELLSPDFDKYMASQFRAEIQKNLEVCLNISEELAPFPQQPIENKQFTGCIDDMVKAASKVAASMELSGSLTKIDSAKAINRALELPPWQNINIMYASIAKSNCLKEDDQLANPLEWAIAAESLLWFADRWPAYMQSLPQINKINQVIHQGKKLIASLPCLEKPQQEMLATYFTQIVQTWQETKAQINQVVTEFSQLNLTAGSDVDLLADADNHSNYRVEGMTIDACDELKSCGVHEKLESSRALFGLFPNHLLVADQLKLGRLRLCYDNVGWENRRATKTHLDNDNVANYYGNFGFSLKGYYGNELVFERKIVDSQEYLYLFGENSQEVLETSCPLSIVGKNITTKLERGTFGLVPNRLTFLTASRADESKILQGNWLEGEEWNNKITTNEAQIISENKLIELKSKIQQAYQQKAKELQDIIYQALLNKLASPSGVQQQLSDNFTKLQQSTQWFLALNYLLQMDDLMLNDDLHGILFGSNKIPDYKAIAELYENQVNINLLIIGIDENIENNKNKWNALKVSLSNSHILNIVFRLKSL
jgi:hypothetical protein